MDFRKIFGYGWAIWFSYYLLFFFISMFRGHKYDVKDVDHKEIEITQELLKEISGAVFYKKYL